MLYIDADTYMVMNIIYVISTHSYAQREIMILLPLVSLEKDIHF